MHTLLAAIRDVWCAVSRRCRVRAPLDDPDLHWLQGQERAARQSAATIHARRIRDGATEYGELNQTLFGRPAWPREGDRS